MAVSCSSRDERNGEVGSDLGRIIYDKVTIAQYEAVNLLSYIQNLSKIVQHTPKYLNKVGNVYNFDTYDLPDGPDI